MKDKKLSDKARKLKNEYAKEWRKKNKDKVKATQNRYWENKAQELEKKNVK